MRKVLITLLIVFQTAGYFSCSDLYPEEPRNICGILGNADMIGVEYEHLYTSHCGFRILGLYVPGLDIGKNDYICNLTVANIIHVLDPGSIFDPVLLIGADYSYHHWETGSGNNKGAIHDITAGGGAGFGIRGINRVRVGFNIWINYDYRTEQTADRKKKGDRFLLPVPIIEISYFF